MPWYEVPIGNSPVPRWFQIYNVLRDAIASGEFAAGDTLPSEAELNRVFGISRTTARAALDKLEQDGAIVRQAGIGSTVLDRKIDRPLHLLASFAEDMRRRSLEPSYSTEEAAFVLPPPEAREALGVAAEEEVFFSRRLLKADGAPIAVAFSWIPRSIFGGQEPPRAEELSAASLYAWLRERCGVVISSGYEYIEAQNLDARTARTLKVAPGAAALVARRTSRDQAGRAVEYAVLHYRGDRYRYTIEV